MFIISPFRFLRIFIPSLLLFITGCASQAKFSSENDRGREPEKPDYSYTFGTKSVRVLLQENDAVEVTAGEPMYLQQNDNTKALINKGSRIKITAYGGDIRIDAAGKRFEGREFILIPETRDGLLGINDRRYRGILKAAAAAGRVNLINILSLDDYMQGVVPAEMPTGEGDEFYEGLKAFAITARTYAYIRLQDKNKPYDVHVDVRDQVYGGASREAEVSNRAVRETAGLILTFKGKPASVFYSSTCGGQTEDAVNVFSNSDIPYMRNLEDGEGEHYCTVSPHYNWTEEYPEQVFLERLINAGYLKQGSYSLKSVEIISRFRSGRVDELQISVSGGRGNSEDVVISGNGIRSIIRRPDNRGILRSTLFDIEYTGEAVVIKGKGNGHGVGMCQWGTLNMSRLGVDYRTIVNHYFPGVRIESVND